MARRKRPYVPKVKGCHECSQRRIDCDRTRPVCTKCSSRGIVCSGFGFKYKFRDGFAPRRRSATAVAEKMSPAQFSSGGFAYETSPLSSKGGRPPSRVELGLPQPQGDMHSICDHRLHGEDARLSTGYSTTEADPESPDTPSDYYDEGGTGVSCCPGEATRDEGMFPHGSLLGDSRGEIFPWTFPSSIQSANSLCQWSAGNSPLTYTHRTYHYPEPTPRTRLLRSLSPLDPSTRLLINHFSTKIAPEMVVIDGPSNGWRNLVLPAAASDDLVMTAVLAASSFHLASTTWSKLSDPRSRVEGTRLYSQAIMRLQGRRDLSKCDEGTRKMIIVAIIVLLVAIMITGCSDFPVVFRMLQSALDAMGGDGGLKDGGDMAEFTLRQIRKMRIYAAPLLSHEDGFQVLVTQANESFDCLRYYAELHPEYSREFEILTDLRRQAFDIYTNRVISLGSDAENTDTISHFISTLETFPLRSPGEHILIWPCFIAAAESMSPRHRAYFEKFLSRQHVRNGFGNIPKALDLLKRIWADESRHDWPDLIPGPKVFIM